MHDLYPTALIHKNLVKQFYWNVGYIPNIYNPKSFNEKVQWLKLYSRDHLMTLCADKVAVRDYVKNTIGYKYLNEAIVTYNNVTEIDFKKLPNRFVLKVNHGSAQNIICENKQQLDLENTKNLLKKWLEPRSNLYYHTYEWSYKNIRPQILCEKYIEHKVEDLLDYKFLCFGGKVEIAQVCSERMTSLKVDFYDMDWNKLPFTRKYPNSEKEITRPAAFNEMIHIAEKLAAPFPLVRVDLYNVEDRVLFGELTFYPSNGMLRFEPVEWDYRIGELLKLPVRH
jgi:hypothetical protein